MLSKTLLQPTAWRAIVLLAVLAYGYGASAAIWQDVPAAAGKSAVGLAHIVEYGRRLTADETPLRQRLAAATSNQAVKLSLPMPDGGMREFHVWLAPVMAPALAAKFPSIQSYRVQAADDARVIGRLSIGPKGFRAYINMVDDTVLIDPLPALQNQYIAYHYREYAKRYPGKRKAYRCRVNNSTLNNRSAFPVLARQSALPFSPAARSFSQLLAKTQNAHQVYRLAVAATYEYSTAVGAGDVTAVMDEINTAITRVNQILERDLAISLQLVANNDQLIYTTSADPYTNNDPDALLDENQVNLDVVIGVNNYDIGHVLSTGGGGLAALASVCQNDVASGVHKAYGETGSASPTGDAFYIDFLAHELGHQLGANHTFNGTTDSCGGNRNAATAYEPGSGISIMSYSGLCGAEDVATNSVAAYHAGSIAEIVAYTRNGAGNCGIAGANAGNSAPVVDAGSDYTIPGGTAFVLSGSASDPDGDTPSYSWEQMDAGAATQASSYGKDIGSNALFRSFAPVATPVRVFPQWSTLLSNTPDKAEVLPTQSRTLNFRLTVRDGNGGVDADDMVLTVDGSKGPFQVTQPNTAVTLNVNTDQVIEWNKACTDQPPVSCSNVDISYSLDGGVTFSPLLTATSNDGAAVINFASVGAPNNTGTARIRVACSDNVFFDVSDVDFALTSVGGQTLVATGVQEQCGTEVDYGSVQGDDIEPNDSIDQAQAVSLPFTITGGASDTTDIFDLYRFASAGGVYDIELSEYGGNDFDLYLYDSDGELVSESSSAIAAAENIRIGLAPGADYIVMVDAYDTAGLASTYKLSIRRAGASGTGGGASSGGRLHALVVMLIFAAMLLRGFSRRPGKDRAWSGCSG